MNKIINYDKNIHWNVYKYLEDSDSKDWVRAVSRVCKSLKSSLIEYCECHPSPYGLIKPLSSRIINEWQEDCARAFIDYWKANTSENLNCSPWEIAHCQMMLREDRVRLLQAYDNYDSKIGGDFILADYLSYCVLIQDRGLKDSNYCKKLLEKLKHFESQDPELINGIKLRMRDSKLMKLHTSERLKIISNNPSFVPDLSKKLLFVFFIFLSMILFYCLGSG
jgi:hypothetical protein